MSLPLVVLAAGLSTRYGRLKQLEPLGPAGEAVMDYNVFDAVRSGCGRAIFVVRPEIEDAVRRHVDRFLGDRLPVEYVVQELDSLPEGFRAPPERRRPWGTAHAILCAVERVEGPFLVCNARDLYGPTAFAQLHDHLAADPPLADAALVGYPLRDTLSVGAGAARGVCHIGKDGVLEHVVEVRDIRRKDGWIAGVEADETPVELSGDEMVSMNLWGLTTTIIEGIRRRFHAFLDLWGAHPAKEFFLSTAVNDQIQVGGSRVQVLRALDTWVGLTYAEDLAPFSDQLRDRIARGIYPERLADGLAGLT